MSRKKNPESFIHYGTKKDKDSLYGTFCPSDRKHGGKDMYIGVVVDKENGIFYHRQFGYHKFTVDGGRQEISKSEVEYSEVLKNAAKLKKPNLILDFGDTWVLNEIIAASKLKQLFKDTFPSELDTLLSLIAFKLLDNAANCYAMEWWEGSYASLLYPNAQLHSQRISEFLNGLGREENLRSFFAHYYEFLSSKTHRYNVLIDSTGLPNDIHFPYTAVNNHNGVISREVRLIMVLDKNSGYPLYFKYVPGNIVDVSTMINVINELKEFNINVGHSILDAGYYCEDNITNLYLEGIQFLTRLKSNIKLYKDLAKEHLQDLQSSKYAIKYRDRLVKIKCVPVNLFGYKGYAYVSIDIDRRNDEQRKYLYEALGNETPRGEIDENMSLLGMFVLISSQELETKDILPLYYTRQAIEQVFDYCKNDVDMLPLRTHNENTFRGHLLLSFLASITYITMNKQMEGSKFCAKGVFHAARGLKCNVYDNRVIPSIPNKKFNDIIKYLKLNLKQSYEL